MTRIEKLLLCSKLTCQCDLGTDDNPDPCGKPAEWMQEGEAWMVPEEWPVCGHCADDAAYPLEEADEKALRAWAEKAGPATKATAFTVEECVYWLAVADRRAHSFEKPRYALTGIVNRMPDIVRNWARLYLQRAKEADSERERRELLVSWALCRAAIRAIENERAKRCSG